MSDVPSRLLKETLRDGLEPPREALPGCLEADALAAWSDGRLRRRDRALVESHAATCVRCQAMLAAMAKTAPPLPTRQWWQTSTVRWLIPVATVSTLALVVWTNVRHAAPVARFEVSTSNRLAPVPETPAADIPAPSVSATGTFERPPEPQRRLPAAKAEQRTAPAAKDAAPSATQPALSAPLPAASAVEPQEQATTFRARDAAPPPVQAADRLSRASARALTETLVIAPPQPGVDRMTFLAVQSPNQSVLWRIVTGTTVERSTDGGTTWQAQSTGAATVRLVAGAAPSPTICWLVGAAGVVLVSQDGQTWQRVAFPEAIDLTAILATDGSNATVTAADGRVFRTTDGGGTWR
jgi:hypothetical protein